MKILHLSHGTLPDWRVEKCALSARRKLGHETVFAGLPPVVKHTGTTAFTEVYNIHWSESSKFGMPLHWDSTKKQLEKILTKSRPDIVHAHNIFAAKMISEFGLPFVFDDHEYTSVYVKGCAERVKADPKHYKSKKKNTYTLSKSIKKAAWNILLKHRAKSLWTKWEEQLMTLAAPKIVTTEKVKTNILLRYESSSASKIFIVPNLPMESETHSFGDPSFHDKVSSVYAGADRFYSAGVYAHRNLGGLIEAFLDHDIGDLVMIGVDNPNSESLLKIKYLDFLPRQSMYEEMFRHSIGLMAFRKHWSHRFKSPNKAYEYAHAGLYVLCTSSFDSVIESFKGNCAIFEDYSDLASQIQYYKDNLEELYQKRVKSFEYAKRNLIWEKFEENLFRAYQLA